MEATMEKPKLQPEHEWLQQLVGEWTFEVEAVMSAEGQTEKHTGSESVRSLEGRGLSATVMDRVRDRPNLTRWRRLEESLRRLPLQERLDESREQVDLGDDRRV